MTARIVVVGDIATDVVARFSGELHVGSDSPATVAMYGGGSAANVATWLAGCPGVQVEFVGRIGADAAGEEQRVALAGAGVRLHLAVDADRRTGCVVVLVDSAGERTMLPDRGASAALSPDDLPPALFAAGAHLHLSGYVLLDESSRAAGLAALRRARDAGMTVSVDASSSAPLRAVGAERFVEWTRGVDLCVANADEAAVLTGAASPVESARGLAPAAYAEVVVKLGDEGALWSDGSSVIGEPAAPAVVVVDTTGAGDAYLAGFLSMWTAGGPPESALAAGSRLAAVAVATAGARPPR